MAPLLGGAQAAHATMIFYDVANISGNTWRYTYEVANDSLAFDIEQFTIYFDLGVYEKLTVSATPAGWDPLVFQPDTLLPDDGIYDALTFGPGISLGSSLGGFSVQFDFLGSGTPGSQAFDLFDPTFAVLDSGLTELRDAMPVSEPPSVLLVLLGLIVIMMSRRETNKN